MQYIKCTLYIVILFFTLHLNIIVEVKKNCRALVIFLPKHLFSLQTFLRTSVITTIKSAEVGWKIHKNVIYICSRTMFTNHPRHHFPLLAILVHWTGRGRGRKFKHANNWLPPIYSNQGGKYPPPTPHPHRHTSLKWKASGVWATSYEICKYMCNNLLLKV